MASSSIHPTSVIGDQVVIADDVVIGPFCLIEGNITIGKGTKLHSHCVLKGNLEIGENNEFFQFTSIGEVPQDLSYKGEETWVRIGNNNTFREYVSVHRGTCKQDKVTIIGDNNLLMAQAHVGHDCTIGNNCIIVNSVKLAGHVTIGNNVTLSGGSAVIQFVKLGDNVYAGATAIIDRDVPSYCLTLGNRAYLKGINIIGLKRAGYSRTHISEAVDFFRSVELSSLSPKHFVKDDELMDGYKGNPIVAKMAGEILESNAGIASFSK